MVHPTRHDGLKAVIALKCPSQDHTELTVQCCFVHSSIFYRSRNKLLIKVDDYKSRIQLLGRSEDLTHCVSLYFRWLLRIMLFSIVDIDRMDPCFSKREQNHSLWAGSELGFAYTHRWSPRPSWGIDLLCFLLSLLSATNCVLSEVFVETIRVSTIMTWLDYSERPQPDSNRKIIRS
jgi:hypothetical protein